MTDHVEIHLRYGIARPRGTEPLQREPKHGRAMLQLLEVQRKRARHAAASWPMSAPPNHVASGELCSSTHADPCGLVGRTGAALPTPGPKRSALLDRPF